MIIQKSAILAKLRDRGQDARADWVDREFPDDMDTLRVGGLLATLRLEVSELQGPPASATTT